MFTPTSPGEKTATLHIKQGDALNNEIIDIKLRGNSTNKLFDGLDCMPTIISAFDRINDTKILIAGKENSDNFFICIDHSIREYSSEGELLECFDLPYWHEFDKFIHKNGKLYFYSASPYCYSIWNPVSGELEEKEISCTKKEYDDVVGKDIDYGYRMVQQRIAYKDYYLDFERFYLGIMFIPKGEERIGTVVGRVDYNENLDYCIAGDYLYWADHCFVKRINIREIIDDLGL